MMRIYYISMDCLEEHEKQRPAILFLQFLKFANDFIERSTLPKERESCL